MKKNIACILLFVLLFNLQVSAEMQLRLSADTDEVIGTDSELKINEAVKIIVLDEGVDVQSIDFDDPDDIQNKILYFNVLTPDEIGASGEVSIDFSSLSSNKIYRVFAVPVLTSNGKDSEDFSDRYTEIGYSKLADRNQYLQNMKDALKTGSEQVKAELDAEGIYMGIDYEMFKLSY